MPRLKDAVHAHSAREERLRDGLALALVLLLPVYFMVAALGTKFGLWGWQFSLGKMIAQWGPLVLGGVALIALVSLIATLIRKPREGWGLAALALLVPLAIFGGLAALRSQASNIPPIHDVTTDPADPPEFSAQRLALRDAVEANPINDYTAPLGTLETWSSERFAELAEKSHAVIMSESYADLAPLPLGAASQTQATNAVERVMRNMGADEISRGERIVEGTFTTFWFGFKDDVVARIGPDDIDFRSVSRVGLSDLGKNAERIRELREETAAALSE